MVLGRTNREYPQTWIRPVFGADLEGLLGYLENLHTVIDATAMPSIVGTRLTKPRKLLIRGGLTIEGAVTGNHAHDLMSAEIIEALSSTLSTELEFFVFRIRMPLEDHQVEGALGALSSAREEGLIRSIGVSLESPGAIPIWQLNDAFDIVLVPGEGDLYVQGLKLAVARRVGLVVEGSPSDGETTHILTYASAP